MSNDKYVIIGSIFNWDLCCAMINTYSLERDRWQASLSVEVFEQEDILPKSAAFEGLLLRCKALNVWYFDAADLL